MASPRKLVWNQSVLFITFSVEEGLPFAPNPLINQVLWSALGRAQELHPVRVCHFLIESTHAHMVVVVDNPDDIKDFIGRFKTESAHAVNRLLGRRKRTVWCEGYDSPVLLTPEDVVDKIIYLYTNPAKDNLEESIGRFPGLSSYSMYKNGSYRKLCPWIRRPMLHRLRSTSLTLKQWRGLARHVKNLAQVEHEFTLHPDAWMEVFGATDKAEVKREVLTGIKTAEEEYALVRMKEGKTVVGREQLMLKPIDTPYTPQRTGRKMWCISSDRDLRKEFISMVRELVQQARDVYARWRQGDYSCPFPVGLYPPALPKNTNLRPAAILCW